VKPAPTNHVLKQREASKLTSLRCTIYRETVSTNDVAWFLSEASITNDK